MLTVNKLKNIKSTKQKNTQKNSNEKSLLTQRKDTDDIFACTHF